MNKCNKQYVQTPLKCGLNRSGFTLIETILSLAMTGILIGIVGQFLFNELNLYSLQQVRIATNQDVARGLQKMQQEADYLETADLIDATGTRLEFVDSLGETTVIEMKTVDGQNNIYWNDEELIVGVNMFRIIYYDAMGDTIVPLHPDLKTNMRRLQFEVTTQPHDNEGAIIMNVYVTPRAFLGYSGFY